MVREQVGLRELVGGFAELGCPGGKTLLLDADQRLLTQARQRRIGGGIKRGDRVQEQVHACPAGFPPR